jgi:hypothetical protein
MCLCPPLISDLIASSSQSENAKQLKEIDNLIARDPDMLAFGDDLNASDDIKVIYDNPLIIQKYSGRVGIRFYPKLNCGLDDFVPTNNNVNEDEEKKIKEISDISDISAYSFSHKPLLVKKESVVTKPKVALKPLVEEEVRVLVNETRVKKETSDKVEDEIKVAIKPKPKEKSKLRSSAPVFQPVFHSTPIVHSTPVMQPVFHAPHQMIPQLQQQYHNIGQYHHVVPRSYEYVNQMCFEDEENFF